VIAVDTARRDLIRGQSIHPQNVRGDLPMQNGRRNVAVGRCRLPDTFAAIFRRYANETDPRARKSFNLRDLHRFILPF
jgi:hypothetical protein